MRLALLLRKPGAPHSPAVTPNADPVRIAEPLADELDRLAAAAPPGVAVELGRIAAIARGHDS